MKGKLSILIVILTLLLGSTGCGGNRYQHYSNDTISESYYKDYLYEEHRAKKAHKAAMKNPHDAEYYKQEEKRSRERAEYAKNKYEKAKADEQLKKERERNLR